MKVLNKIFEDKEEFENSERMIQEHIKTKINDIISGEVTVEIREHSIDIQHFKNSKIGSGCDGWIEIFYDGEVKLSNFYFEDLIDVIKVLTEELQEKENND